MAVVFVINLLKRHPNCRVLIHRKNAEECKLPPGEDPYDMTQEDPACCNALDSSLWELKVWLPAYSVFSHSVVKYCFHRLYRHTSCQQFLNL